MPRRGNAAWLIYFPRVEMALISFGRSALVGAAFGSYPARRASRLIRSRCYVPSEAPNLESSLGCGAVWTTSLGDTGQRFGEAGKLNHSERTRMSAAGDISECHDADKLPVETQHGKATHLGGAHLVLDFLERSVYRTGPDFRGHHGLDAAFAS